MVALNIKVGLYKTPVTNSTANIALYKRANGYRPFLYNKTHDICAFFANRKRFPFFYVMMGIFLERSNLNHTCPYNDAIMVKNLVLNEDMFHLIPIPEGDYRINANIYAYNDLKASLQVFISRKDVFSKHI
ncbi:uncharacterized protein LOC106085657 [Stomoxys calcitrans]|nr:uncharacterized protein LOC106085657 [Stomoxys calcitrans]